MGCLPFFRSLLLSVGSKPLLTSSYNHHQISITNMRLLNRPCPLYLSMGPTFETQTGWITPSEHVRIRPNFYPIRYVLISDWSYVNLVSIIIHGWLGFEKLLRPLKSEPFTPRWRLFFCKEMVTQHVSKAPNHMLSMLPIRPHMPDFFMLVSWATWLVYD